MTRFNTALVLILSLLLFLTGCVDRNELKADVLAAVRKHEEIHNYRFSGSLDFSGTPPAETGARAALPAEGSFSWQGVASFDPLRAEAEIRMNVPGRDPLVIPLVIQHNKMAFRLPGMLPEEQYFSVDLAGLAKRNQPDSEAQPLLSESGLWLSGLLTAFVESIDPRQFDEPHDRAEGRRIVAEFGEKQPDAFNRFWQNAWPEVLTALARYGAVGTAGGAAGSTADYTLEEPVRFTFDLTEDGYLEQIRAEGSVSWQREDGSAASRRIKLVSRHDDINAGQTFTKTIPENAVPFDELLKWLPAASGDGGHAPEDAEQGADVSP